MTEENNNLAISIVGMIVCAMFVSIGWAPTWLFFTMLITLVFFYGTKFSAMLVIGSMATAIFTVLGWLPSWIYFSFVALIIMALATKVATEYVNTGQNK